MGDVVIKCPNTGKEIPTGMSFSRQLWEAAKIEQNQVRCPACGQTHTWDKKDAKLLD